MKSQNRESKFNVDAKNTDKRTCDGYVFDSVMEMKFYRDVILPQMRSGAIRECELQKPYVLQPKFQHDGKTVLPIVYVADFYIRYEGGQEEVIDTKGCADSVAKIKRKMFWYVYPNTTYKWVCYSKIDGGWSDYDEVQRNRKRRKKEKRNAEQKD